MAGDITFQRIAEGIRWRLAEAEAHLPLQARRQIDIRRVKNRVRRGEFAFDAELLIAAYSRAWELLLEKEQPGELGAFLEFGVFYGSSLACMAVATTQKQLDHVRIVGFDSFEGLPATATTEDSGLWYPGQFCSSLETTLEFLRRSCVADGRVDLVKGWFNETATPATAQRLGLTPQTLTAYRCERRGPRYYKIGRRCLYKREDLEGFIEAQAVEPESTSRRKVA